MCVAILGSVSLGFEACPTCIHVSPSHPARFESAPSLARASAYLFWHSGTHRGGGERVGRITQSLFAPLPVSLEKNNCAYHVVFSGICVPCIGKLVCLCLLKWQVFQLSEH